MNSTSVSNILKHSIVINFKSQNDIGFWFGNIKDTYMDKIYAAHVEVANCNDCSYEAVDGQNVRAVIVVKEAEYGNLATIANDIISSLSMIGVDTATDVSYWHHNRESPFPSHVCHSMCIEHVYIISDGLTIYGDYHTENECYCEQSH